MDNTLGFRNRFRAPETDSNTELSRQTTETKTESEEGSFHDVEQEAPLQGEPEQNPEPEQQEAPVPNEPEQITERTSEMATSSKVIEAKAPKELRINLPKEFHRERDKTFQFLQDTSLYLALNEEIYNSDKKKIAFCLSFMNGGPAQQWKEAFITEKNNNGVFEPGTYATFHQAVKDAFSATDTAGNARASLQNLRQTGSADEYVSQFRILTGRSGITDDTALVEYFIEGLNTSLLQKIFSLPTIPSKIKEWYDHATQFDNQWT